MRRRQDIPEIKTVGFKQPRSVMFDRIAAVAIIPVSVFAALFFFRGLPQSDHSKVAARPFVWPENCPPAVYADGYPIPRSCVVASNAILSPESVGLTYNARLKGKQWFRIGNDALYVYCGFGNRDCSVYSSIRDKFLS